MIGSNKLSVAGIAIKPGISKNGILYNIEELNRFTDTLIGRPMLKDHQGLCDNTVGLIENSSNRGDGIVMYEGWVKEDGTNLLEKIKDGRIHEVSIGAFAKKLVKESEDDDYVIATGLEAMELSLTPTPAVKGTSLAHTLDLLTRRRNNEKVDVIPVCENFNVFEDFSILKKNKEDIKMAEEIVTEAKKPTPEEEAELKKKAMEEEEKKKKMETGKPIEQSVKFNIDTLKLDETIQKLKEIDALKEKINKAPEVTVTPPAVEEKKDTTKGKVGIKVEAETNANAGQYMFEHSDLGNGFMLYKQPKADGSLI